MARQILHGANALRVLEIYKFKWLDLYGYYGNANLNFVKACKTLDQSLLDIFNLPLIFLIDKKGMICNGKVI